VADPDENGKEHLKRRRSAAVRIVAIACAALFLSTISISPAVTEGTPKTSVAQQIPASAAPTDPAIMAGTARQAAMPVLSDAHIEANGDTTIIKMTASAPLTINAFALSAPYRVVVDMSEVHFDLASSSREVRGLVRSWRAGLFATGRSRIVFDATGPLRIAASRVDPRPDGTVEIVIELQSISAEQFTVAERIPLQAKPVPPPLAPVGKGDRDPPHPQEGPRKLIVVLDPGHGGLDAGTVSPHTGMPEKQVVLEFSKLLEKKLAETGRYEVYLTRTTDTFVPLGDRVKFARAHHADLLVSIHADAELDRSVRGSTVFTRAEKASDAKAAALAQKENQSDALAGIAADDQPDDVADILVDLVRRETHTFSHALAETLVEAIRRSGHMVKQDPHRSAQLVVLKAYDFPSVLIELGFLSNKDDEGELVSPKWRDQTAESIVSALDRFFASHDPNAIP
jgi:N-acetylmuramoyl-L-alanine amidase